MEGSLDEEAVAVAALGGPGDFASAPKDIEAFMAGEALTRGDAAGGRRQFGEDAQGGDRLHDPGVNGPVTLNGRQFIPWMGGRHGEAVGPVAVVRDQATAGGTAEERTKEGLAFDVGQALGIPKGGGRFGPGVEAQQRDLARGGAEEECLVEGHVPGGFPGPGGEDQEPGP